ncbi:hypothetical protein PSACC_03211 [Paramicrosporidium saccamoebae]|uniref:GIT Spa2 homology (SHD) domain-containing protein n=1 Tax=Paramicrosporidium saccamoebae TaxID=1246581 RepID=A0A2H9TGR6_9FUNG|nr:hypothetical protein PSACC_03211 [Paramicrosporidium saccamoebae]
MSFVPGPIDMISNKARITVVSNVKSNEALPLSKGSQQMDGQYRCLHKYLAGDCIPMNKSSSRKLERLTVGQLNELLTDVCDEIQRRNSHSPAEPFLAIRLEYSPKRNQARQKLADLVSTRFVQLVANVHCELERRFPELQLEQAMQESQLNDKLEQLSYSLASLPGLNNSSYNLTSDIVPSMAQMERLIEESTTESSKGVLSATLTTPKTLERQDSAEILVAPRIKPTQQRLDDRLAKGQTFNFDCLDSLIQDLNTMIGMEQTSEMELLKQRHAQEVGSLKDYTKHLEEKVIPSKNHEIAKHSARVEELEGRLMTAKKEHSGCATKIAEKDLMIEEQAALIKTIQSAYMSLQKQIASSSLVSPKTQSQEISSNSSSSVGVFTTIWSSFARLHERVLKTLDDENSSKAEKLSNLKNLCTDAQKLVREAERLALRMDTERMPWIAADVENLISAKSQCMQALSYCIVSCRDMSGKVNLDREVREAVSQLARHVRGLVDAAELVASRAQVPSSPISTQQPEENDLTAERHLEHLRLLIRDKLEQTMAAFHSLRNFVEGQSVHNPHLLIELPDKMRSHLDEALARTSEIQQTCHALVGQRDAPEELRKHLASLDDAIKKLQLTVLSGTGILADACSQQETINACRTINGSLRELQLCATSI